MSVSLSHVDPVRELKEETGCEVEYSFCTLVTDPVEYKAMVAAFQAKQFTSSFCEFIYIDNANGNNTEAFTGYNRFLQAARGRYIVLLHQDILPILDDRAKLDQQLANLTQIDPTWRLCGNAGALEANKVAYRITDPYLPTDSLGGPFPVKVMNLDENFIIVRRDANLALSRDLAGFHLYGADLCLVADVLGWSAYVIDFHLLHKSGGFQDASYRSIRKALASKYRRAFKSRWYYAIGTQTHRPTFLSGAPLETLGSLTWGLPFGIFVALTARRVLRRSRRLLNNLLPSQVKRST